jgi:hypothetical protein
MHSISSANNHLNLTKRKRRIQNKAEHNKELESLLNGDLCK